MAQFLICNDDDLVRIKSITNFRRGVDNTVELYAKSDLPAGRITVEKSVPMKQVAEMLSWAENFGSAKITITWDRVVEKCPAYK